jgi:anti-sigma regulatory factor (Ser/Thr protein kinase)
VTNDSTTVSHGGDPEKSGCLVVCTSNSLLASTKFTPEGGEIQLSARGLDGAVRVEVRDSGPGIPVEEQQHIFEAFYRLGETDKKTEGTGLGLAITRRLVELHGGNLSLDSQPGSGSCFYFTLPGAEVVETPEVPASSREIRAPEFARVLVIEDDRAAAQLIQSHLTSAGYDVVLCEQPALALEMAAELQPSAVTMDIVMKPVSGWDSGGSSYHRGPAGEGSLTWGGRIYC